MSIFDCSMLYTKIPRDKLLHVLNEIIDFAFKGGVIDYLTIYSSEEIWSKSKGKAERSLSRK